jgi:uncharacterized damage-inducible protein DinB
VFLVHSLRLGSMTDHRGSGEAERRECTGALAKQRKLLLRTVRGLSDEQVRLRPTASALCLGGLIKHVTLMEGTWCRFIMEGASAMRPAGADSYANHAATFDVNDDETLALLRQRYEEAARSTDELIMSLPSLDVSHPLPAAPWFEQGATWSARRVVLHVVAETAQHAGHADIIRETIDGAKSMG